MTERTRQERALAEKESRLRTIVENAPVLLFGRTRKGRSRSSTAAASPP
ncbi:hypothetical protein ACFQRB_18965 [Halobaculum litoreum]|uniref:Uncharacterized protein n=1 Tax=Halobaculum litoreum TaxID=3031998 RepID=A0ABD5XVP0_9EURY